MFKAHTRNVTSVGDSKCVTLSPAWLRRYNPKKLHMIYSDGLILVLTQDHLSKLDTIFDRAVVDAIRKLIHPEPPVKDQQPTQERNSLARPTTE